MDIVLAGLTGALATFVDAIIGMGFGMLSTSLLLSMGVYPAMASASVHVAKTVTGLFSGGSHLWLGNVKKELLFRLAVPGVIGGVVGAYFLASFAGSALKPYVAGILLVLGLAILYQFALGRGWQRRSPQLVAAAITAGHGLAQPPRSVGKLHFLGFTAAFVDAIGGGGWGAIATPGLILSEQTEPHKAIGTVNLAEVFVAIAISGTFFATIGIHSLRWDLIVSMLVGGLVSAPLGAYLCKKLPARPLAVLTALALITFNVVILANAL